MERSDGRRLSYHLSHLNLPKVILVNALVEAFVHLIVLVAQLLMCLLALAIRLFVLLVAMAAIAVWPRADKSEPYWHAVLRRAKEILPSVFE